jgi:hypothetical protein
MKCPQGCRHPVYGENTMRVEKERVKHDPPRVIDGVPGGPAVVKESTRRYRKCRVCGWVVDV